MSVLSLTDPSFPQLQVVGDPESMRGVFQKHLRTLNNKAYQIRDCHLSRVSYRRGCRCVLQYTLRLAEADSGAEQIQWVTGVMYADDKTRRKWEKLRDSYSKRISEIVSTFEPFSFIPDLGMTVQGQDDATGRRIERRFYAKVYREEDQGQRTHQVLRALWKQTRANGEGFTVAKPLAYLNGLRTLLQEEAPGTPLEEILLGDRDTTQAVRT